MRRAWKEIAEGWRLFARRAEKGTSRLVAPPREEKPWDCWGELESPSKDAVCVLGVERGGGTLLEGPRGGGVGRAALGKVEGALCRLNCPERLQGREAGAVRKQGSYLTGRSAAVGRAGVCRKSLGALTPSFFHSLSFKNHF